MSEIHVLDKHIAELIAAGEVIERPASIVKELLENSIDAGSKHITVEIKSGGIDMIRVTDDGKGIAPEDAETAFLRHATSKLKSASDLNEIFTLGFRGEALASICAVSKVSLITRQKDSDIGCHVEIAGGEVIEKEEAGCPLGTTIIVKNIFYNTPARMKFLKKDVSEANAIAAIVEKIAVSNPSIAFKFIRDGRMQIQTVGDGKLFTSIHSVFGKIFADSLIPVDYDKNGIKVTGFISKPLNTRAKRSMQYFFLNGRTVKNMTMTIALEEAYKGAIMIGKFPACVLLVDISPSIVDVNVHPTKTEIRFSDEHIVFDAIYFACKNAISIDSGEAKFIFRPDTQSKPLSEAVKLNTITEKSEQISFESPKKENFFENKSTVQNYKVDSPIENDSKYVVMDNPLKKSRATAEFETPFFDSATDIKKDEGINIETITENPILNKKASYDYSFDSSNKVNEPEIDFHKINTDASIDENALKKDRFDGAKMIGELFRTYIMLECKDALYLIDKHAAHERLIYNKLKDEDLAAQKQYLLEPQIGKFARDEYASLISHAEEVAKLGFDIDDFGDGSIIVRSIPPYIQAEDAISAVTEIASNILTCKKEIEPHIWDDLLHSIACKAAIKAHDKNSELELEFIIDCLRNDTDVKQCPHGRPITVKISKYDIEKKFGRIQ